MTKKYPAILILIFVVIGIVVADEIDCDSWLFLGLSLSGFVAGLAVYYRSNRLLAGMVLLIALLFISSFNYTYRQKSIPPGHVLHYCDDNQLYTVYGTIDDWPKITENQTSVILTIDSVGLEDKIRSGKGRIQLNIGVETTSLGYGDRIFFTSRLYSMKGGPNLSGFDYRKFMNLKGVFASAYIPHHFYINIDRSGRGNLHRVIEQARRFIRTSFSDNLKPASAALATGFLIGETRDIPVDIYNKFRETGTLHLLAVSGSNVALIVIVFVFIFKAFPISRMTRTILLLLLIFVFSNLAYNQPSVIRASIMAALAIIGRGLERRVDYNNIIAATALIILLWDPRQLFDVGFQLSFVTAWGLIIFTPLVAEKLMLKRMRPVQKYAAFLLISCLIAQLISMPLTQYYFQRIPLIGFVSNLLIVPSVSLIVIGEVILLLANALLPQFGFVVGLFLNPILELVVWLLNLFDSVNLNIAVEGQSNIIWVIICFVAIALAILSVVYKKARKALIFTLVIILNINLAQALFRPNRDYEYKISSISGGTLAFSNDNRNIIVSDLMARDYLVTDKIILPFLKTNQPDSLNVFVLSNDFPTINDIATLADSIAGRFYFPATGTNIFNDIILSKHATAGNDSIVFCYKIDSAMKATMITRDNFGIVEGAFFQNIDSGQIIFASERFDLLAYFEANRPFFNKMAVIKASINVAEIESLSKDGRNQNILVLTGSLKSGAREFYQSNREKFGSSLKLVELSQVGVVKLVNDFDQFLAEY